MEWYFENGMRLARRAALHVLLALAAAYAVDWSVFQIRRARGGGMGSVDVDRYLTTPLKGSKNEYDYLGTAAQACSRSLFPQYAASAWNAPCWWVMRHRTQWLGRTPWSAAGPLACLRDGIGASGSGSRGTRANQGVRPTAESPYPLLRASR
jgi:hypothetical protein